MSILKKGKDLIENIKPMLMDTESISGQNDDLPKDSSSPSTSSTSLLYFSGFLNGAGIGLLLGILLGLAISPVVSAFIGTLSGLLAVLLGLSDKYLSAVKSIRIGAFGFFCVGGIFLGMHIRTNNGLLPERAKMMKDYMAVGFTEEEARDFIAYREFRLIPSGWTGVEETEEVPVEADSTLTAASVLPITGESDEKAAAKSQTKKETATNTSKKPQRQFANPEEKGSQFVSILYSSEVNLSKCDRLVLLDGNVVPLEEIKHSFRKADGDEKGIWTNLANNIDPTLPEDVQSKTLLAVRDCFCETGSAGKLEISDCKKAKAIKADQPREVYLRQLKAVNPLWKLIAEKVSDAIPDEHEISALQSITKNICDE